MYLMIATRPDIAYPVTKLAQFGSCPTPRHWKGILRVLCYLRKHDSVRLCLGNPTPVLNIFPSSPANAFPQSALVEFFDASLMDCVQSRKSTGAYVFFLQGSCISWASKKQHLIALSSTEAEFIAGTDAAKELTWIAHFLADLGPLGAQWTTTVPVLCGDNQGALAMAKSNTFRPRTKHIHVRERFIAQMVQDGHCQIFYVPTRDMIADALTKALPRERLKTLLAHMGLQFHGNIPQSCQTCLRCFTTRNELYCNGGP